MTRFRKRIAEETRRRCYRYGVIKSSIYARRESVEKMNSSKKAVRFTELVKRVDYRLRKGEIPNGIATKPKTKKA